MSVAINHLIITQSNYCGSNRGIIGVLKLNSNLIEIAYAEEDGQVILHYSPDDKLVLVEILDFRRFMSKDVN